MFFLILWAVLVFLTVILLSLVPKNKNTLLLISLLFLLPVLSHSLIMWLAPVPVKIWFISETSYGVLVTIFVYLFCLPLCFILLIFYIISLILP